MKNYFFLLSFILLTAGCKKEESCEFSCSNKGVLLEDCSCECPINYTGTFCQEEVAPKSMQIRTFRVLSYPPFDNGTTWDPFDAPDLYIKIYLNGDLLLKSAKIEDVETSVSFNEILIVNNPTDIYTIELWDFDDFDPDDFVGGMTFSPYKRGLNFADEYDANCPNCAVKFGFSNITYNW